MKVKVLIPFSDKGNDFLIRNKNDEFEVTKARFDEINSSVPANIFVEEIKIKAKK